MAEEPKPAAPTPKPEEPAPSSLTPAAPTPAAPTPAAPTPASTNPAPKADDSKDTSPALDSNGAQKVYELPKTVSLVAMTIEVSHWDISALRALIDGEKLSEQAKEWLRGFRKNLHDVVHAQLIPLESGVKALMASQDPVDAEKLPLYQASLDEMRGLHEEFGPHEETPAAQ